MTVNEHIEVGTRIILRVVMIALLAYFLYLIRDVVLIVFLAVLTAAALAPMVALLERHHLSRVSSVVIVYGVVFAFFLGLLAFLIPLLISEGREFGHNWPVYAERFNSVLSSLEAYLGSIGIAFDRQSVLQSIGANISDSVQNVFSTTVSFFGGLITVLGFFFLSLYLSLEEKGIEKFCLLFAPREYHAYARSIAERMQGKVSQWLFGQLLLMLIVFGMYFIGLSLLGVPYALATAFFGGLVEIIPYVGPVVAAVPAVILGLLISPGKGLAVLAFYVIAHQLEGHIIAPQVLKRSIGLSPVVIIIAILIGARLGGSLGILLSIPTVMMLSVFVEDILVRRNA